MRIDDAVGVFRPDRDRAAADAGRCVSDPRGRSPGGSPVGGADRVGYWLRMTTSQAIPPLDRFGLPPTSIITADGQYLVQGIVPAIFPGPLVIPMFARQVSDEGRAEIIQWARDLGLLDGQTDFTGDNALPGGITGRSSSPSTARSCR